MNDFFRIDSRHNKSVVSNIIKEVGTTKFTEKQIDGMCVMSAIPYILSNIWPILCTCVHSIRAVKSHMKYLRDSCQLRSPAVQHKVRIRSQQQRVSITFVQGGCFDLVFCSYIHHPCISSSVKICFNVQHHMFSLLSADLWKTIYCGQDKRDENLEVHHTWHDVKGRGGGGFICTPSTIIVIRNP